MLGRVSDLLGELRIDHPEVEVWAAGGVVTRQSKSGLKILIIHRPRYDDWSLPKGKLEKGESLSSTALREVLEETGRSCELGKRLPLMIYQDGKNRSKAVVYWLMTVRSGSFRTNSEVDEAKWVKPKRALRVLDYERDADLLRHHLPGATALRWPNE